MTTNFAFHNDTSLAALVRQRVADHAAADEIIQGSYWQNGHGCFIGCIAHGNDATEVERLTGFPVMLTRIAENIFEALPSNQAKNFLPDVIASVRVGADLSLAPWKFLEWCVSSALVRHADDKTRSVCEPALNVIQQKAQGLTVSNNAAADAAADAVRAAAYAADADVRAAAYAAYAAAYAARAAAYAARAAAYAAADAAAYAARAAADAEQAIKFIEIIRACA